MRKYVLRDFETKEEVFPKNFVFTGENGPWEVAMNLEALKIDLQAFKKEAPCLAKYLPFMPVKDHSQFVSLSEAATPLVKSKSLGKTLGIDLYFKLESKNPTGSFKDRGSAVDVTVAKELGARGIALASTGNMAASCACYAAQADLPCYVFVPEGTPMTKLSQVIAYGGRIVQVKGNYNDAARLAAAVAAEKGFYLAGDYAYRVEGAKTAAFELIDQLAFIVPDQVFVPIGCGTNIASYAKGFSEYRALGLISETPQLVGVQAEGASPVVQSFKSESRRVAPQEKIDTFASAIAVGDPLDGAKALHALYSSSGKAVSVTDAEIVQAQQLLARKEGIFAESAAAATLAALFKLAALENLIGKMIVCVITGDGLKDPAPLTPLPSSMHPDLHAFCDYEITSSAARPKSLNYLP